MPLRKILIVGSTGRLGGATIKALSSSPTNFELLALTRSPTSHKAVFLAAKPNVTLVAGEPSNPAPIFVLHPDIYGVFCITVPGGDAGSEERQCKALIDMCIRHNVEHFVLVSVDRGGEIASDKEESANGIEHFREMVRVETYLKRQIETMGSKMRWTILRPTALMDTLNPGMMGRSFASMWLTLENKPLQLVSAHDVGVFVAKAFCDPAKWGRKAVSLAGDELTLEQAKAVFRETMGGELPETYSFVGSALQWAVGDLGKIFQWYKWVGHGADIGMLRKEESRLQDFGTWLFESSKFVRE